CRSVIVERGGAAGLGKRALALGASRVLLVTDAFLLRSGMLEAACADLQAQGIELLLFSDVVADPPAGVVQACAAQARNAGVDLVIGFGGGSSLDVAKLAALLAAGKQSLDEVYGVGLARGLRLPLILVPTTAGTGSEVTPISIVTTGEGEKKGVVSP